MVPLCTLLFELSTTYAVYSELLFYQGPEDVQFYPKPFIDVYNLTIFSESSEPSTVSSETEQEDRNKGQLMMSTHRNLY